MEHPQSNLSTPFYTLASASPVNPGQINLGQSIPDFLQHQLRQENETDGTPIRCPWCDGPSKQIRHQKARFGIMAYPHHLGLSSNRTGDKSNKADGIPSRVLPRQCKDTQCNTTFYLRQVQLADDSHHSSTAPLPWLHESLVTEGEYWHHQPTPNGFIRIGTTASEYTRRISRGVSVPRLFPPLPPSPSP